MNTFKNVEELAAMIERSRERHERIADAVREALGKRGAKVFLDRDSDPRKSDAVIMAISRKIDPLKTPNMTQVVVYHDGLKIVVRPDSMSIGPGTAREAA